MASFLQMTGALCLFLVQQPPVGQGLLIHEFSRSHTTTYHSWYDSSGWVISSSQRPLPDSTQHSQQIYIHAPLGFEPTVSAGDRTQTYALDRAATGIDDRCYRNVNKRKLWRTKRIDERGTNHCLLRTCCNNKTQQSWSRRSIRNQFYSQDRRNVYGFVK
jgi:hypothetical protein